MMRMVMSRAAAGLLRALLARAGIDRESVLLAHYASTEWHSLTFTGERHEIALRIPAPAEAVVERLLAGLADAEFAIPGQIVADIGLTGEMSRHADGAISLAIEALTIAE